MELTRILAEWNLAPSYPLQIEKHVVHVLEQEASRSQSTPSRLSSEELAYAKEYADNMDSHLNSLVLRHMPANFKKVDRKKAGILLYHTYAYALMDCCIRATCSFIWPAIVAIVYMYCK